MSTAEFRIVITHEPGEHFTAYRAQVFNLAGDWQVSKYGETAEEVERAAREWIERASVPADPARELWVDGAGRDAAAPTSTPGTLEEAAPRLIERLTASKGRDTGGERGRS